MMIKIKLIAIVVMKEGYPGFRYAVGGEDRNATVTKLNSLPGIPSNEKEEVAQAIDDTLREGWNKLMRPMVIEGQRGTVTVLRGQAADTTARMMGVV